MAIPATAEEDTAALGAAAAELQQWIEQAPLPPAVATQVVQAYQTLCAGQAGADFVAVRSSAMAEDAAAASFAGMFRSLLNVHGSETLLSSVRTCRVSLFAARSIAYRARQGRLPGQQIAVIVQKMVNAEKSGALFTIDPTTGNPNHIVIEGAWGLGELVVQGDVRPDRYVVDRRGATSQPPSNAFSWSVPADASPRTSDRQECPASVPLGGRQTCLFSPCHQGYSVPRQRLMGYRPARPIVRHHRGRQPCEASGYQRRYQTSGCEAM